MSSECAYEMQCRKIGCQFQHPRGFVKLCIFQEACKNRHQCKFRHVNNAIPDKKCDYKTKSPHAPHVLKKAHTESKVQVVGCENRDLFLMLDMSGSMAGRPVQDVRTVCQDVVSSVMKHGDQLEMTTFASRVQPPLLPLAAYSEPRLNLALAALAPGGRTALWEAIIHAVNRAAEVYSRKKKRFVEVVVMTDGDDTSSNSDAMFEAACQKVAKPGCVLKFFLISCGSSPSTQTKLRQLCAPAHAKVFIEDNVRDLQAAFGKVKRELVQITTTKTTVLHTDVKVQTRRRRL